MRSLFMALTCAALSLGPPPGPAPGLTATHSKPVAMSGVPGQLPVEAIPRPVPGGPAVHSTGWRPGRGINRAILLTVARGESATPADRVALLQCPAQSGTHPRASEACKALDPVSGDLGDLKISSDSACGRKYEPITVSASGLWDGNRLWFERTFGNPCELRAYTGSVFNF